LVGRFSQIWLQAKENKYSKHSSIFLATYGKCRYKNLEIKKKNRIRKAIKNFKNSLDSSTFDFLKLAFLAI
jgi:hypothetical protein